MATPEPVKGFDVLNLAAGQWAALAALRTAVGQLTEVFGPDLPVVGRLDGCRREFHRLWERTKDLAARLDRQAAAAPPAVAPPADPSLFALAASLDTAAWEQATPGLTTTLTLAADALRRAAHAPDPRPLVAALRSAERCLAAYERLGHNDAELLVVRDALAGLPAGYSPGGPA